MDLTILNAVRPGDGLEIHYINSLNQDVILETMVYDVESETEFLIHNPLKDGKLYMIALHETVTAFSKRADYGVIAFSIYLVKRKKMGNIYTIQCRLTSSIEKQQRRNFFRVKVYQDIEIYVMVDKFMIPVNYYIFDPDAVEEQQINMKVTLSDISGGGVGFKSNMPLPHGTFVYSTLDFMGLSGELWGSVVRCVESITNPGEYEVGLAFDELTNDVLRLITSFVFTRQQKTRRKEIDNG